MDPLTAALTAFASVNQVITALINKASSTEIDAMIAEHLKIRDRIHTVVDMIFTKTFHLEQPK